LLGNDLENHESLEELRQAKQLYEEALTYCEKTRDKVKQKIEEGRVRRGLGSVLTKLEEYPLAEQQLRASLQIFREIFSKQHIAWTLSDLGKLYHVWGHPGRAMNTLSAAMRQFEQIHNHYYEASVRLDLAETIFDQGGAENALQLAQKSKEIADARGHRRLSARSLEAISFYTLAQYPARAPEAYKDFCAIMLEINTVGEYVIKLRDRAQKLIDTYRLDRAELFCDCILENCKVSTQHHGKSEQIQSLLDYLEEVRANVKIIQNRGKQIDEKVSQAVNEVLLNPIVQETTPNASLPLDPG
jgi:tetratricopeptide (TPR) repeat protein